MVGPFALDGYDVLAPLGATGRTWRAVCLADGRPVVLRRCIGAAARRDEVRRRAAVWGSLAGAGVVAVRDVLCQGEDLVVVSDLAAGGGLDRLLSRRRTLTVGQVVTLVVPIAQALAAAHGRGLGHGRISAGNIVLDRDGRPMLTDYAVGNGEPAADVVALTSLARECLADPPGPEVDARGDFRVDAGVAAVLDAVTDAAALAVDLLATVPAEPLVGIPGPGAAAPAGVATGTMTTTGTEIATEPPRPRGGRVVALVAAAVVVAVLVGAWWGRQGTAAGSAPSAPTSTSAPASTPTSSPTSAPSPSPTRSAVRAPVWSTIVRDLERRRALALSHADARLLASVELAGTLLWRHDLSTVRRLRQAHQRLFGCTVRLRAVRVLSADNVHAVVRVTDALSSYAVVDGQGALLSRSAGRPWRTVVLTLVDRDGRWLIARAVNPRRQ